MYPERHIKINAKEDVVSILICLYLHNYKAGCFAMLHFA